jgi:TolA-binding protein
MKKILLLMLTILFAGGFFYLAVSEALNVQKAQKLEGIQIESKELEVNKLEVDLRKLNIELREQLEKKDLNQQQIQDLKRKIDDAEKREQDLQQQLQAKLNRQAEEREKLATAARTATRTQTASAAPSSPTGTCEDWMRQAGVPVNHATRTLIAKESGCRPNAVNPTSGACGIPQAYPCSKLPCTLTDPVCQLKWMQNYVSDRYGSWDNALAFWYSKCGSRQGCWY